MFFVFNGNQLGVYMKHAGVPHKSEMNFKNTRYLLIVAVVWNISFGIQLASSQMMLTTIKLDDEERDFENAVVLAL